MSHSKEEIALIDVLYDQVDDLLEEEKFDAVDEMILSFLNEDKGCVLYVAFLTITSPYKLKIKNYFLLLVRAYSKYYEEGKYTPEQIKNVLDGFEQLPTWVLKFKDEK